MRVLILGGRAPVALDHARRYAAQGATAYIADSISCRISAWSRSVTDAFRLPRPRDDLSEYGRELTRLITTQRIDLVLPTCEEAFYLSAVRPRLPSECTVFVAPLEELRELHSKFRFLEVARRSGVLAPASTLVTSIGEAREWAAGRAVVLKPEYSRFGVWVQLHPGGIPTNAPALPIPGPWVVQEFLRGRELCSYSIAVAGRVTAHVTYEPTYRLSASSSYYFEPRSVPALDAAVAKIVATIGFTGQISFDWIEDATGTPIPLECNPRAISGLHLFGLDDPLPDAIRGVPPECVVPRQSAPGMIAAVMLFHGLPMRLRNGEFRRWQADWRRARDVLWHPGDAGPTLGGIADLGAFAALAARHGSSVRAAATRDVEWDGEALSI